MIIPSGSRIAERLVWELYSVNNVRNRSKKASSSHENSNPASEKNVCSVVFIGALYGFSRKIKKIYIESWQEEEEEVKCQCWCLTHGESETTQTLPHEHRSMLGEQGDTNDYTDIDDWYIFSHGVPSGIPLRMVRFRLGNQSKPNRCIFFRSPRKWGG